MASQGNLFNVGATITAADDESEVINMSKFCLTKLVVEDDLVGTALTFLAGVAEDSLFPLYNQDGTSVEITLSATNAGQGVYALNANDFAGIEFLQVVSNGNESADVPIRLYGYHV